MTIETDYEDLEDYEDDKLWKSTPHPNSVLPFDKKVKPTPRPFGKVTSPDQMPSFVQEPVNSYIIRGKSAELKCQVSGAVKAYFTCNGEAMAESNLHKEIRTLDLLEVNLEVTRNNVEEFFGTFTCRCDAWSAKGKVSSRNVSIQTACK